MSLKEDLQEIDGVGEATADAIMGVLEDHSTGVDPKQLERVREMLERGSANAAKSRLNGLLES